MRILGFTAAMVATLALTACQKADTPAAATTQAANVVDPQPSEMMKESFSGCTWGKVQGATMSIWAYACNPEGGSITHMVADDSLPGFFIEGTHDGETSRSPAIIAFKKAADAPIEAILSEVRAKSPGPHSAQCVITPASYEGALPGVYEFAPVGAVETQWNAFSSGEADATPIDAPCGDLGLQMSGDRIFEVLKDDPTTVLFINFGSEIQIFDVDTLRSVAPAV